ncbi:rRNA-processing protein las1 [Xylographa opegraphella]|nr:rRNA-processing protein las1 [Xylographa opegraphella]
MARQVLNFHPWDEKDVLEALRIKFYPPKSYVGPDLRKDACAEVAMWKMKRPIPDDIESTGLLTEAVLNDQPDTVSSEAMELMYSAAFSRFVTLLVDGYRQKRKHQENMYDVGVNIGLPKRFVELRHEINHGKMPTLATLRTYTQQALNWLHHDYWKHLGATKARKFEDSDPTEAFRLTIDHDLAQHRVTCLHAINSRVPPMKAATEMKHSADKICSKVVKLCQNDIAKLQVVIGTLLELGMLIPVGKKAGSSMTNMFRVWDTLLWAISSRQVNFLHELTAKMTERLVPALSPQIKNDVEREGIGQWLLYIYTDGRWAKARNAAHLKVTVLMAACLANPCFWTLHVALAVITKKAWKKYRPLYEKMILDAMEADEGSIAEAEDANAMDTTDGNDNEPAEESEAAVVNNDTPPAYGLDTVVAALLDLEEDGEERVGAAEAPSALTYTLCLRTMTNPWYTAPVGTFK